MKTIQSSNISGFTYNRYEYLSNQLQKAVHFGVLKPQVAEPICGTVYFMHAGNGDDEQFILDGFFSSLSENIISILIKNRIQIILPGIGITFLKKSVTHPQESYSDYFFNELIPLVEKETHTTPSTRFLSGISMGGHASLNCFMRKPELFSGVGAHFPGVLSFNPFHEKESQLYREKTKISEQHLNILLGCHLGCFKNEAEYFQNDPISLARRLSREALQNKSIYLDAGSHDEFGLFEGTKALSNTLFEKDIPHQFRLIEEGNHDAPYVKKHMNAQLKYLLGALS